MSKAGWPGASSPRSGLDGAARTPQRVRAALGAGCGRDPQQQWRHARSFRGQREPAAGGQVDPPRIAPQFDHRRPDRGTAHHFAGRAQQGVGIGGQHQQHRVRVDPDFAQPGRIERPPSVSPIPSAARRWRRRSAAPALPQNQPRRRHRPLRRRKFHAIARAPARRRSARRSHHNRSPPPPHPPPHAAATGARSAAATRRSGAANWPYVLVMFQSVGRCARPAACAIARFIQDPADQNWNWMPDKDSNLD